MLVRTKVSNEQVIETVRGSKDVRRFQELTTQCAQASGQADFHLAPVGAELFEVRVSGSMP